MNDILIVLAAVALTFGGIWVVAYLIGMGLVHGMVQGARNNRDVWVCRAITDGIAINHTPADTPDAD